MLDDFGSPTSPPNGPSKRNLMAVFKSALHHINDVKNQNHEPALPSSTLDRDGDGHSVSTSPPPTNSAVSASCDKIGNTTSGRASSTTPRDKSLKANTPNMFDIEYDSMKRHAASRKSSISEASSFGTPNSKRGVPRSASQSGATIQLASDFFKLRTARMFQILNSPDLSELFEEFLKSIFAGK